MRMKIIFMIRTLLKIILEPKNMLDRGTIRTFA
jgi:hypothetical protein